MIDVEGGMTSWLEHAWSIPGTPMVPTAFQTISPSAYRYHRHRHTEQSYFSICKSMNTISSTKTQRRYLADRLNKVSRSFAIVIPAIEQPLSDYLSVSYLICRVLDNIEDCSQPVSWRPDGPVAPGGHGPEGANPADHDIHALIRV